MWLCQTLHLHPNNNGLWTKNIKLPQVTTIKHVDSILGSAQNTTNLRRPLSRASDVTQVSKFFEMAERMTTRVWFSDKGKILTSSLRLFSPSCFFSCGGRFLSSEEWVRWDATVGAFARVAQNEKKPCHWAECERKERKVKLYPTGLRTTSWSCFLHFLRASRDYVLFQPHSFVYTEVTCWVI